MPTDDSEARWSSAWPDAVAFAAGLGVARWLGWSTADLVWSLWLSSLVVGYATIVWTIGRPVAAVARGIMGLRASDGAASPRAGIALAITVVGGALMLAFFTVHFGGFHYVHSQFLNIFFPVGGGEGARTLAEGATYVEVVRRYWLFLPAAFVAEREAFARPTTPLFEKKATAGDRADAFKAPYRNVVRLHMLIFFFAGAHFARLDGFAVYAVVYAVYFFPWRLLRRRGAVSEGEVAAA
jgi:hypothetical protein